MITIIVISSKERDKILINSLLSSQDDFEVAGLGRDGYDAIRLTQALQPDVAIIDFHLENISGTELIPLIKRRAPNTAVILLSPWDDEKHVCDAIACGISGYLLKKTDMDKLVNSVRIAYDGGCYISSRILSRAFRALSELTRYRKIYRSLFPPGETDLMLSRFSQAELRIIKFVCEGKTNKEIAEHLSLTIGTVRNYISTVMQKAGTRNRVQMAIFAFKNRLNDF
ncbi:DNA-binding response regulator [Spirochaetia bacterium]|nr:DNA-binding response regulator [Spirochaetia bacterium]GHV91637.1 DNA-binding response regulator [Spirochaetia bacterium]